MTLTNPDFMTNQENGGAPGRKKVLCYSPYNFWQIHGVWEITTLHALRLRGAVKSSEPLRRSVRRG